MFKNRITPPRFPVHRQFGLALVTGIVLVWPFTSRAGEPPPEAGGHVLSLGSCADFRSYDEIRSRLTELATERPDLARVETIGKSVEGRDILGLVVSRNPGIEEDEPEVRIVSSFHGDECLAMEIAMRLAEELVEGYGTSPGIKDIVDRIETWIFPLANPDGYAAAQASRLNSRGIDLNRNFGFMWIRSPSTGSGQDPFSEPETRAFWQNGLENHFALGLTYHTVANYVNAVWNYTPVLPRDSAEIEAVGLDYKGLSTYEFVFGWHWYAIYGDITDWSYGTAGTLDYTIECQSDTDVEGQWTLHEQSLRAFLSWANRGIRGLVTDRTMGKPMSARIRVDGYGEPVFTDPVVGDFHKVLLPGTYTVRAEANGYRSSVRQGITVGDGDAAVLDIALEPDPERGNYAFQVVMTTIPQEITNPDYPNLSVPSDALGPPDGIGYSMSPKGMIVLDLGEAAPAVDEEGPDITVVSSTESQDPCEVYLSVEGQGWQKAAAGSGDIEVDLASLGLKSARYVLLVDTGSGPMDDAEAGYDLDAVVNLHPYTKPEADGGSSDAGPPDSGLPDAGLPDTGAPEDGGKSKSEGDASTGPDGAADSGNGAEDLYFGGCGCSVVGAGGRKL